MGVGRVAHAEAGPEAVVWYRASEQCPAGTEFLGRLANGAERVRLAGAGDHIDFVVTLLADQGTTVGRLERQTRSGTVAIRELRDVSCARVADALALSLGLALEPGAATEDKPETASESAEKKSDQPPVAAEPAPDAVRPTPIASSVPKAHASARATELAAPPQPTRSWVLGLDAGARVGVAPSLMPQALPFVELDPAASDFALRLSGVVARGSTATNIGPVEQWIFAGRIDVCPWRVGNRSVSLRPCAAFELGETRAGAQVHQSSLWAAPGIAARASFAVSSVVALELGVGALVPLDRSEVDAAGSALYSSKIIAVSGTAGISFRLF